VSLLVLHELLTLTCVVFVSVSLSSSGPVYLPDTFFVKGFLLYFKRRFWHKLHYTS